MKTERKITGWILKKNVGEILPVNHQLVRFEEEANKRGIDLMFLAPSEIDIVVTKDDRKSILVNGKVVPLPDFVIPRLGSATGYYASAVIRHLERLGVQSINGSEAINTVRDKMYSMQILAQKGLPVPKTMLVRFPISVDLVDKQIGFPLVMKTLAGSLGNGVHLVKDKDGFQDLMDFIHQTDPSARIILQEFISKSHGKDLRVLVVGGRAIGCMLRESKDGNFKANYTRGGMAKRFEMTKEIEILAIEATKVLGLDVSGVDILFDGEGFKICEVNSSAGFKGFEEAYPEADVARDIFDYVSIRTSERQ